VTLNEVIGILWRLLAVLVLVLLNGLFVAAEFALVKVRDSELTLLSRKGHRRAKVSRHIIKHLDQYLSGAQLGITLASLGLGWIGEPVFSRILQPVMQALQIHSEYWQHTIAFVVGFSVITFLHISAGEQAPKWLAIQKPLATTLFVAWPMRFFYRVAFPFIWVLNESSLWLLRRMGIEPDQQAEHGQSEEELRLLFTSGAQAQGQQSLGREVVLNALDLRHRIVREVLRPRQEIVFLATDASMTDCLNIAERTRLSRFPLCEGGDLDKTLGVVHVKDLYRYRLQARTGADLKPYARKLVYIPETARLEKLLKMLLDRKQHFAIVVDEYGGTTGMVTLEDILEELVGEIQDEFDQEQPLLVKKDENTWELQGALPVRELAELVGEPLADHEVTTTSGWITQRLGGFPKVGDVVILGAFELRVEEVYEARVARLQLKRVKLEASGAVE
jgi:CBS domain containing-hemolysin-like protein